jgi:hypothetical protein
MSDWIPESDKYIIFTGEEPTCPTHGKMHANIFLGSDIGEDGAMVVAQVIDYTCPGFDGEGCDFHTNLEYRLLGYADEINFEP